MHHIVLSLCMSKSIGKGNALCILTILCTPRKKREVHAHKGKEICTNHMPNEHFMDDVCSAMCMLRWMQVAHVRHKLPVVCRITGTGEVHARWPLCFVHSPRSVQLVHALPPLRNVHKQGSIRQSTTNVVWPMPLSVGQSRFPKADRLRLKMQGVDWCRYRPTDIR